MTPTPRSYFESMYANTNDPWGFASRAYEQRKYALTLDALPRSRYRRAFEPGCSIGVLTKAVADRCDELVAYEIIPQAARAARERVANLDHVRIEERAVPQSWPDGRLDLIILSEIIYYFDEDGVAALLANTKASLDDDGHVIAVHYRGQTSYPLSGDRVHELLRAAMFLERLCSYEEPLFRFDVFARRSW